MKKIFLLLSLFVSALAFTQTNENVGFLISAQGKTIKALLTKDSDSTAIIILNKKKDGKLVIINQNIRQEDKMQRNYMLYTSADEDLGISFAGRIAGTSAALLKDIYAKTKVGQTYYLYTIATPKDPAIAATVRVKRVYMCKVVIK